MTRAEITKDRRTAATDAIRSVATGMLRPLEDDRAAEAPGEAGVPALRTFADRVPTWTELPDPTQPARAAAHSID